MTDPAPFLTVHLVYHPGCRRPHLTVTEAGFCAAQAQGRHRVWLRQDQITMARYELVTERGTWRKFHEMVRRLLGRGRL